MKILAILLVILFIFALWALVMYLIDESTDNIASFFRKKKEDSAKWIITPRNNDLSEQEIFLTRGNSQEFLFWPTPMNEHWSFAEAMFEAEIQAGELNRTRKQLSS